MKKVLSVLLSLVLLLTCVPFAFAADQEELTLERLMQAYEEKDMDFLRAAIDTISPPLEGEEPSGPAPRWASGDDQNSACHQLLTAYGFLFYLSDMQVLYGMSLGQAGYSYADLMILAEYSAKPDRDESDFFTFSGHFYDPDTQKSWISFSETARDRAENHYSSAIIYSRQGNRVMAMQQLGRALHYLQDANEPHHAALLKVGFSTHRPFEKVATALVEPVVESLTNSGNTQRYDNYMRNTVGASLHTEAVFAKGFSGLANTPETAANYETRWRLAAMFTIANSVGSTAALLYRFSRGV